MRCCARSRLGAIAPAADAAKKKTIARELSKLYAAGAIDQATYDGDRAIYADVKRRIKRLTGARKAQLAGALASVEGIAARGQLRAGRLYPLFLTLQRNAEWWSSEPLLANGQRVSFEGSELVWQYVPGQGIQLHPLANFGKLNAYAKGSRRNNARNTLLLDELMSVAVPRGGGLAWEYYFTFDGGSPPWVSGLAQGTGLQAIARSAAKLGRMPELLPKIQAGLKLFEQAPPTGVRVADAGGRALRAVLVLAQPAHPQRLHPVARRPLRRRADHRRPARGAAVRRRRRDRAQGGARRSTPAPGRTTRAGRSRASPTSATTRCCATSSPGCATAPARPSTATPSCTSRRT